MKLTKFFSILGLGLCVLATGCSDDDDEQLSVKDICGTYNGTFVSSFAGAPYANDVTDATVTQINDTLVRITFAEVTGSPAMQGRPAAKMTDMTLDSVRVYLKDNAVTFKADPVSGQGMMRGKSSAINHSKVEGVCKDNKLTLGLDFSFGRMYEMMGSLISAKYEGTKK